MILALAAQLMAGMIIIVAVDDRRATKLFLWRFQKESGL